MQLTSAINRALAPLGIEVRRRRRGGTSQQIRGAAEMQALLLRNHKVQTVFDVGANIGDSTATYRAAFPTAIVHAFEPASFCVETLRNRFGADRSVRIVQAGVAADPGTARLNLAVGPKQNSILERPQDLGIYGGDRSATRGTEEVKIVTLDNYAQENGIETIQLLKIDVEGAERLVIEGTSNLLSTHAVDVIGIEIMFVTLFEGQELYYELVARLSAFGYTLYDIPYTSRAPNGQLKWGDALFVSPRMREEVVDRSF